MGNILDKSLSRRNARSRNCPRGSSPPAICATPCSNGASNAIHRRAARCIAHRPYCEVKKGVAVGGVICPDFDPVRIAREYEAAGASCLSVLTDEKFFPGLARLSPADPRGGEAAVVAEGLRH